MHSTPTGPPTRGEATNSDRVEQAYWPLTAYQRDIVAIGARYPDLPIAQVVGHARLDGTVNLERMRECVRRTYLRNDALRLRFEFRDGEFVQHVGTELPELEFVDFTGDADPAAACRRWIDEASERVLPLDGPLTRAAVLVDRTDSFLVYACFHHAVGDAWGINLALSQVLNEYASERRHRQRQRRRDAELSGLRTRRARIPRLAGLGGRSRVLRREVPRRRARVVRPQRINA